MAIPFSELPGRHERHYRRRCQNPLFPRPMDRTDEDLLEAQRLDHEELLEFIRDLRGAVESAVNLKPNEESQVLLDLKGRLERLYEQAHCMADEQENNKAAIRQLIDVIMKTISAAASGDDTLAVGELQQEAAARDLHFALLNQPLVADLLHPESLIEEDELVPALLGSSEQELVSVLGLFDAEQQALLFQNANRLLEAKDPAREMVDAWGRLDQIKGMLTQHAVGNLAN